MKIIIMPQPHEHRYVGSWGEARRVPERGGTQRGKELKKARLQALEEKEERAQKSRKDPLPTL